MGKHYVFYVLKVLATISFKTKNSNSYVIFSNLKPRPKFRLNCRVGTLEYIREFTVAVWALDLHKVRHHCSMPSQDHPIPFGGQKGTNYAKYCSSIEYAQSAHLTW